MTGRRLEGRVALVTGAVRPPGMGAATARRLATEGATVVCADAPPAARDPGERSESRRSVASSAVAPEGALSRLVEEIGAAGGRAEAVAVEVSDADAAGALVTGVVARHGRLDVCCVMTGGTGTALGTGPLLEVTETGFDAAVRANLVVPTLVATAAARAMVERGGGAIVVLSSYAGAAATERYGAFGAARAGLSRIVEVLAAENGPSGVRVNAVLPLGVRPGDGTENPGLAELADRTAASGDDWVRSRIPLGRLQDTDEVAALVAFLCSDEAAFVSGQSIVCAGGATLRT